MKIEIVVRKNHSQWGGDMNVINQLIEGLNELGIEAIKQPDVSQIKQGSKVILTNTCLDQRATAGYLIERKVEYSVLPFHEDFKKYFINSMGVIELVTALVNGTKYLDYDINLNFIEKYPELISYANCKNPQNAVLNMQVLEYARIVFPSSNLEEATVIRDSSKAKTKVFLYPTQIKDKFGKIENDEFRNKYKIKGDYIIQVGRLETRKNQLYTVLAAAELPISLVFIATKGYQNWYTELLIKTIVKFRKYPTYIISEEMDTQKIGELNIVKMEKGEKLPWNILGSAYSGSLANVHPAFYELPGLTYMESIALGVKTICSNNASINEYIENTNNQEGIHFVNPSNIEEIKKSIIDCIWGKEKINAKLKEVEVKDYSKNILSELI